MRSSQIKLSVNRVGTFGIGLIAAIQSASVFAGEPIHLKPGQCILIGSQEVCALKGDDPNADVKPKPTKLATCKYGDKGDEPGMKGYTLYQIVIKEDGSKTETSVKSFGSLDNDKADCEKAARELDRKLTGN